MKKKFCSLFLSAVMLSSNLAFGANYEPVIEKESCSEITLPLEFVMEKPAKEYWKRQMLSILVCNIFQYVLKISHKSTFVDGDTVFAEGVIVEWPEDKNRHVVYDESSNLLASAALYKLLNAEGNILVLRDSSESIVGYLHVYNLSFAKLFKPITVTLYDSKGSPLMESVYGFGKQSFKTYSATDKTEVLIEAKHQTFSRNYTIKLSPDISIDPALLLLMLQVQTSKESYINSPELYLGYAGQVDFTDLEGFSQGRMPLGPVKKKLFENTAIDKVQWSDVLESLSENMPVIDLNEDEKEQIIQHISQYFEDEEITPEQILDLKDSLSDVEKSILSELISERLPSVETN